MSPYGYIQLFLFGLLCCGAISEENVTCTTPRAQSNIHINQVYGDWFWGQTNLPDFGTSHKSQCFLFSVLKINETFAESSINIYGVIRRGVFSIENVENAGTWHFLEDDNNGTMEVIYLSADGTTMVTAGCSPNRVEPQCILLGKQLPISSEKMEEVLRAVELAGIPGSRCHFTWKSEATCPST